MEKIGRNANDPFDGFLKDKKICLMDRDPKFTKRFRQILRSIECKEKVLPTKSPNLNGYVERFIGTMRREIGNKFIPFSCVGLRNVLKEHLNYYNSERNHQGLEGNRKPRRNPHDNFSKGLGEVKKSSRLGNTLNFYYREVS